MFDCRRRERHFVSTNNGTTKSLSTYPDDQGRLHEHVVRRRGDRARADPTRIRRRPRNLDRVHVREAGDERDDGEVCPGRRRRGERVQRDQQRERPYLERDGRERARVDELTDVRGNEEQEHAEHFGWDAEKIGLSGGVPEVAEGQREVGLRRCDRNYAAA